MNKLDPNGSVIKKAVVDEMTWQAEETMVSTPNDDNPNTGYTPAHHHHHEVHGRNANENYFTFQSDMSGQQRAREFKGLGLKDN